MENTLKLNGFQELSMEEMQQVDGGLFGKILGCVCAAVVGVGTLILGHMDCADGDHTKGAIEKVVGVAGCIGAIAIWF